MKAVVPVKTCINPNGELQQIASAVLFTLNAVLTAAWFYPGVLFRWSVAPVAADYLLDLPTGCLVGRALMEYSSDSLSARVVPVLWRRRGGGLRRVFSEPALTAVGGR